VIPARDRHSGESRNPSPCETMDPGWLPLGDVSLTWHLSSSSPKRLFAKPLACAAGPTRRSGNGSDCIAPFHVLTSAILVA